MTFNEMMAKAKERTDEIKFYDGLFKEEGKRSLISKINEEIKEFYIAKETEKFDKDSEASELADIVICCMAFAGTYGIDLNMAVKQKLEYNKTRGI